MSYVVAIDVGIKNLGLCVFDFNSNKVVEWENVTLVPSGRYTPSNNVKYVHDFVKRYEHYFERACSVCDDLGVAAPNQQVEGGGTVGDHRQRTRKQELDIVSRTGDDTLRPVRGIVPTATGGVDPFEGRRLRHDQTGTGKQQREQRAYPEHDAKT